MIESIMKSLPEYFPYKTKESIHSLKAYMAEATEYSGANELWSDRTKIYLTLGFKENLKYRTKPVLIPQPHPAVGEAVCLIVKKDRRGVAASIRAMEDVAAQAVHTVMTTARLKSKYNTNESKRELIKKYSLFLCDDTLYKFVARMLGSKFETYKKFPLPISLEPGRFEKKLKKVLNSTHLYMRGGSCSCVCVGTVDMDPDHIYENIKRVVDYIIDNFPDGLMALNMMALKSQNSPALPIYKSGATVIKDDNTT